MRLQRQLARAPAPTAAKRRCRAASRVRSRAVAGGLAPMPADRRVKVPQRLVLLLLLLPTAGATVPNHRGVRARPAPIPPAAATEATAEAQHTLCPCVLGAEGEGAETEEDGRLSAAPDSTTLRLLRLANPPSTREAPSRPALCPASTATRPETSTAVALGRLALVLKRPGLPLLLLPVYRRSRPGTARTAVIATSLCRPFLCALEEVVAVEAATIAALLLL